MMRENILEIDDLTHVFKLKGKNFLEKKKELYALSHVSLTVRKGETLGVIGESGCGKSTLGKCVVRLHRPTSGKILFKGFDLAKASISEVKPYRKQLQMIFQDPFSSLDPRETAIDSIEEALIIHNIEEDKKKRRDLAMSALREVGLDVQHANRYAHEFSGGQRQRINIARALCLNPEFIVCDEPVSALDVSIQAQVINLLKDLQEQRGLTYMFISHDLSVIKHVSDRIAIMYLGQIVELCEAEEIYKHPLHPYTRALLSAIPPESPFEIRESIRLKGDIPTPIGMKMECPLCGRCPYATDQCKTANPPLEDVGDGHLVACFLNRK